MIRRALGLSGLPIFATVVLALAVITLPGRRELLLRAYLLLLAALALAALVGHLRRANPVAPRSAFDLALRGRRPRPERLPDLERIERELTLAGQTAADLHFRLRPRLRRIAAQLLRARRGIDLDEEPQLARQALGDELWELVRPDREPPRRRGSAGLDAAAADRLVAALEGI